MTAVDATTKPRKPYKAPKLVHLGSVRELTAAMGNSTVDNVVTKTKRAIVSRLEFKKDVRYLSAQEREAIALQALAIPLATYRYKSDGDGDRQHLGFIIDDQPDPSPAVHADKTHVDEYGYTSMLLAVVQKQELEIRNLRDRMADLEKRLTQGNA